jgi:hypothetical protein
MIVAMETDTFQIVNRGAAGYAVEIRLRCGGAVTGQGFKVEAAARAWVAKHAPDADEIVR